MTHTDDLDKLFNTLRRSEPHLPDDGFTAIVTARLPQRREVPVWQKNILVLFATVVGCALSASLFPLEKLSTNELMSLMSSLNSGWVTLIVAAGVIATLCGSAIWASEREII